MNLPIAESQSSCCLSERIGRLEEALLPLPQVEIPVTHRFAPGVYWREIFAPAGTIIIGHEHKTEHFAVILSGSAAVVVNGELQILRAPDVFVSKPGTRKVAYVIEDMRFATIHATDETDIEALENELMVKSPEWLEHQDRRCLS